MRWNPFRRDLPAAESRDLIAADPTIPPTWAEFSGGLTYSGVNVSLADSVGLPAVGSAIRLLCETVAQLPLNVYQGRMENKRLRDDSWQFRLLDELPGNGDFTAFDLKSDIVECLETRGNAYLQKVKFKDEIIALIVMDPARVRVEREDGSKIFRVRNDNGGEDTFTASTIMHIRGWTASGSDVGVSPITMHRMRLGVLLAKDQYEGRFYNQGTSIGGIIQVPDELDPEDARELLAQWRAQATGLANSHNPVVLQGGATFNRSSMTMEDAQFVESANLNLRDVANIFRIPPSFLGLVEGQGANFEQDNLRFYQLSIAPRLSRIEAALRRDADLFPDRSLYPEFHVESFLRTDAATQAEVDHKHIQAGVRLVDEVRARQGLAPLPPVPDNWEEAPGKVPQITPVGGAPNPVAETGGDDV
jgi:HK97 family phage portal protein